jgi:hypothetical protein
VQQEKLFVCAPRWRSASDEDVFDPNRDATGQPFVSYDNKLVLQICETWHRGRGIDESRLARAGDESHERNACGRWIHRSAFRYLDNGEVKLL